MDITDEDEAPIEPMLLEAIKYVVNLKLRREIEDALTKTAKNERSANRV